MRFDEKSTALSFWQQLISVTDEIILKIAKYYFKFAVLPYTNQFQWHRLQQTFRTVYLHPTGFL